MRPHLERIELQRECRQRQFQMAKLFGASIRRVIHGTP